jgi:hypothetical protein
MAKLVECERRAADAIVRFSPRRSMVRGETQQFVVTASERDAPAPDAAAAPVTAVEVPLRCEVQAELRGATLQVAPDGSGRDPSWTGRS